MSASVPKFKLSGNDISKSFTFGVNVFSGVNIELHNGELIGIVGENGAGKSTLVRLLCGVLTPSKGEIQFEFSGKSIDREYLHQYIGMVSPYLNLYEEFTAWEHLSLSASLRGIEFEEEFCARSLEQFSLEKRKHDHIRTFSSGMKQRLKYVLAIQHKPAVLILDEPSANIDSVGVEAVLRLIERQIARGGGVIIATNEERESSMCSRVVSLKKSW
ncbi:MAG: ABC transporter ATP-binding protein [Ignavibacteria bacterium]|nr:ABC transporter ATP-binding protein [Ignavibacteria bacterium]